MWLPETAVDLETLDILAEEGIRFTILAQHQAKQVRPIGESGWREVGGGRIDPTTAYTLRLPSGRAIALFFYDGAISRSVAFERLLTSGEAFAQRLVSSLSDKRDRPQIIHIATDGESYGHHHQFGEMALAYALNAIESKQLASLTNYGEFLERHPPAFEVELLENTSWSCTHGLERWHNDCGCNTGSHPGWNQGWRRFLREALDWLRDRVSPVYEDHGKRFLKDPWEARDRYIEVILDPSRETRERFLHSHASRDLSEGEKGTALKLLELQRHAMLMYTSCGWFFDDLAGIETVQVLQYAGRALQLAADLGRPDLEAPFLDRLAAARSNLARYGDGRAVWDRFVRPAMTDLPRAAAHFAIGSVFERPGETRRVYCYRIDLENEVSRDSGQRCLSVGRVCVTSAVTLESAAFAFGALHLGDHDVNAGVMEDPGEAAYRDVADDLGAAFADEDIPEVLRRLDRHFGAPLYSIRDLFRDEQRDVLGRVLEGRLADIETAFRQIYDTYHPPMHFLAELGHPIPAGFHAAAGFVLDISLRRVLQAIPLDTARLAGLLEEVSAWQVRLDDEGLAYLAQQALERLTWLVVAEPESTDRLDDVLALARELPYLPFSVDLRRVQNVVFDFLGREYAARRAAAAVDWLDRVAELATLIKLRLPDA